MPYQQPSCMSFINRFNMTQTQLVPAFEIFTSGVVADYNIYANLEEICKLLEDDFAIKLENILAWDNLPFGIGKHIKPDGSIMWVIQSDGIAFFIGKFGIALMKPKPPTSFTNCTINFDSF